MQSWNIHHEILAWASLISVGLIRRWWKVTNACPHDLMKVWCKCDPLSNHIFILIWDCELPVVNFYHDSPNHLYFLWGVYKLWCPDTIWTWQRHIEYIKDKDLTHKKWIVEYDLTWYVAYFEVLIVYKMIYSRGNRSYI